MNTYRSGQLKVGMVGGGVGAFIGTVHRMAMELDGEAALIAGCLSSTPERARESARALGLSPDRSYASWREMLERESALPASERVDVVTIVTPNFTHAEIAGAFASKGFHVVCDKPLTCTLAQAQALEASVRSGGGVFCVTYNYSGFPLVQAAAGLVRSGELGAVRRVFVEYHQGWLATDVAANVGAGGQKQAAWRADPKLAGAGALGDIGTHAEHLLRFVTGAAWDELSAQVRTFVPGRRVDDDASVTLRMHGGGVATLTCSQVCVGAENSLSIRVHGERGSLHWRQEEPNTLIHRTLEGEVRVITRASAAAQKYIDVSAINPTRLPGGHPEGFIEAFANIYRAVFRCVREGHRAGSSVSAKIAAGEGVPPFPTLRDGVLGVAFIESALASAAQGGAWVKRPV